MSREVAEAVEAARYVAEVMRAAGCFEGVEVEPAAPSLRESGVAAWITARVPSHGRRVALAVFVGDDVELLMAKLDFDLALMESRAEGLASMGARRN
ncbi:MAG: hypothetical protein BGO49_07175 [Planctomycetales bacterium 71-10]|nr:MAG: hypothetical protein BGO49_07175 [Planctomycetales bacterium 71-10]